MAIEIIDGFKVNSAVPVDNRIVASGSTARNAINYKYEGLRVFDTSDSIPYVWLNNTWEKENNTALSIPSGVTPGFTNTISYRSGQILKVYNSNKLLTNSNMFEVEFLDTLGSITSKSIAINHSTAASVSSTSKLDVNGSIKATSFEGSGANITNIDPVNFNTTINKIKNTQIDHGANGYILQTVDDGLGNLSVQWKNPTSIISPNSVSTQIEATQTSVHYLTFVPATSGGNLLVYQNSSTQAVGVIPLTGQVVVKNDNSPSSPPFSFLSETNSGLYRSGAGSLAISILGNKKIEIDNNGLKVNAGNATNPGLSFIGGSNYGMYQTTSGSNRIGIVVAGNEMIRIKSLSTQGNGSTTLYGDGNVLSLVGNTHTYIEFYRQGSATPDSSSTRSGFIGYPSSGATNLVIKNEVYGSYVDLSSSGAFNAYTKRSGDFGVYLENTLGLGLAVKNSHPTGGGESIRLIGRSGMNFISLHDGLTLDINGNPIRTFWMGHGSTSLGNNHIIFSHELSTGIISTYIGSDYRTRVNTNGLAIGTSTRGGTFMKSVYHGWFQCTYNTGGAGITFTNLYGSGMSGNGFSYASGVATGGNSPTGYIKINTPSFTNTDKVIVQVTPRYQPSSNNVSRYMIFTAQVNSVSDINIYFYTTTSNTGWNISDFAFNISIFEIVQ